MLFKKVAVAVPFVALLTVLIVLGRNTFGLLPGYIALIAWNLAAASQFYFYSRLHLDVLTGLYPDRERARGVRVALAGLRKLASGKSTRESGLFACGGFALLWMGSKYDPIFLPAGSFMVLLGMAIRQRMRVPPAALFLGSSDTSSSAFRNISHVCMPWSCISFMRSDGDSLGSEYSIDLARTRSDSFRTNSSDWMELVTQFVQFVPTIVLDGRAMTNHVSDEFDMIRKANRTSDVILLVNNDGTSPLLDHRCEAGFTSSRSNLLKLRLSEATRLVRYVSRGKLGNLSLSDDMRDHAFFALHEGEWAASMTLQIESMAALIRELTRNGGSAFAMSNEEFMQWNSVSRDTRSRWREEYLDSAASRAHGEGHRAFRVFGPDGSTILFDGITSHFQGQHYGSVNIERSE